MAIFNEKKITRTFSPKKSTPPPTICLFFFTYIPTLFYFFLFFSFLFPLLLVFLIPQNNTKKGLWYMLWYFSSAFSSSLLFFLLDGFCQSLCMVAVEGCGRLLFVGLVHFRVVVETVRESFGKAIKNSTTGWHAGEPHFTIIPHYQYFSLPYTHIKQTKPP